MKRSCAVLLCSLLWGTSLSLVPGAPFCTRGLAATVESKTRVVEAYDGLLAIAFQEIHVMRAKDILKEFLRSRSFYVIPGEQSRVETVLGISLRKLYRAVLVAFSPAEIAEINQQIENKIKARVEFIEAAQTPRSQKHRGGAPRELSKILLSGHHGRVVDISFAPDGKSVITASMDEVARIWNAADGQKIADLPGHEYLTTAHFSPDGRLLVTATLEGKIIVWDMSTFEPIQTMLNGSGLTSAAVSPDSKWLVTSSWNGPPRIWDLSTGKLLFEMGGESALEPSYAARFSPDGKTVAISGRGILLWHFQDDQVQALWNHGGSAYGLSFSADGRMLVSGSVDGAAIIGDAQTGRRIWNLNHPYAVNTAAFSSDGRLVATGADDGFVRLWNTATGLEVMKLEHGGAIRSVSFSPDMNTVAVALDGNTAVLWDIRWVLAFAMGRSFL